jgi:hypothetical protein
MQRMSPKADPEIDAAPVRRRRSLLRLFTYTLLSFTLLLVAVIALLWGQREQLARDYIDDLLRQNGISATYTIETIGPEKQIIRDVVVGDPAAPDMTIGRAEIALVTRLGLPQIRRVTLDDLRLWGRVVNGQPSFGALDPVIFTDSTEPFSLPDLELQLNDARALIEGDYGPVAITLRGGGRLRDGFVAELAAIAPRPRVAGCTGRELSLYGEVAIADQRPSFMGPLRYLSLACPEQGVQLADGGARLDLLLDADMAGIEGDVNLAGGESSLPSTTLAAVEGEGHFVFRNSALTSRFDLSGRAVDAAGIRLARAHFAGTLRAAEQFARLQLEGSFDGSGLLLGPALDDRLAGAEASAAGTLGQPLIAQMRRALASEMRASTLDGRIVVGRSANRSYVSVPAAMLRGAGGAGLIQVSRGQVLFSADGLPQFSGNFATGGANLPRVSGRMEQLAGGGLELQLTMAPYAAADARLAVPQMRVRQNSGGAITFDGQVLASGALPGGFVRGLDVPVNGAVSPSGAISLWQECVPVRFTSLAVAQLQVNGQQLTLCPPRGRPILSYGASGLSLAAGVPSLTLRGRLGDSPLELTSGAVGLAWPGALAAQNVVIALGSGESVSRLKLTALNAMLAEQGISGTFAGAEGTIGSVPLVLSEGTGSLAVADGALILTDSRFTVSDRQPPPPGQNERRFHPLLADNASLTFANGQVTSSFLLRHPASGTPVSRVAVAHDLASGRGHADLVVDSLRFTQAFQPADLTFNLYGTVSNVRGLVTGNGRIDWNADGVTSSTGAFSSDGLDLAAAFGPVAGARGTIRFTDLIGLTTAPGQRIRVATINPGIEVLDGDLGISLTGGTLLRLEDARWPFLGGTIEMHPVALNLGAQEERTYVIEIRGLEAQRFIAHMGLGNISATGTFDGTIPVIFDAEGFGRLEGGELVSRAPGGSVSYIGELTYEDLSPIANYAFAALRDMDYERMQIQMNGPLTGELVTSVRFDGVRQGDEAEQNFITRRLANLPIRFIVNVRAPFYSMAGSLRSLYDPSAVRDPRGLGLLSDDGRRFVPAGMPEGAATPTIQPPESEAMP